MQFIFVLFFLMRDKPILMSIAFLNETGQQQEGNKYHPECVKGNFCSVKHEQCFAAML